MQEKHGIEDLLSNLLRHLCVEKPLDPIQYCIDSVQFNPEYAKQVCISIRGTYQCFRGYRESSNYHELKLSSLPGVTCDMPLCVCIAMIAWRHAFDL